MNDNNYSVLTFLVSPDNAGLKLHYDATQNRFLSPEGHEYAVIEGVPILLPDKATAITAQTEHHLTSAFSYIDHYQKDAELADYFEPPRGEEAHEIRRLHQTIGAYTPPDTDTILDVGCGSGWVAASYCPKGIQVISMDVALVNPRKVLKLYPYNNHFAITADVYHLPIANNSIHCIIASEIIEHVPDVQRFIANLYAALKPGGSLIITTPYNEKIVQSVCIHCNKLTPLNAHLHSFNKKKMEAYMLQLGIGNYSLTLFSNKYVTKLRSFVVLRFLPYSLWRGVDALFNLVFGKQQRMLLRIKK